MSVDVIEVKTKIKIYKEFCNDGEQMISKFYEDKNKQFDSIVDMIAEEIRNKVFAFLKENKNLRIVDTGWSGFRITDADPSANDDDIIDVFSIVNIDDLNKSLSHLTPAMADLNTEYFTIPISEDYNFELYFSGYDKIQKIIFNFDGVEKEDEVREIMKDFKIKLN